MYEDKMQKEIVKFDERERQVKAKNEAKRKQYSQNIRQQRRQV